jgi:PAS domain S-box-containing protein
MGIDLLRHRKDGSPIEYSLYAAPIHDSHGQVIGNIAMLVDIAERKQAEEALRESEERFRLAFENANTGVCLVDLDGNLTRVNNKMCEIFGYTKQELERMTVNDIAHPEDIDKSPEFIQETLQGKIDRGTFEKRYFHKKGHVVTCQVSSSLVRNADGLPLYFISHIHDITERKRAEEALRQSEERYRTILEDIEEGYFEVDLAGRATFINDSLCKMYGYPKEEFLGMDSRRFADRENAKKAFEAFNRVDRTGEPGRLFDYEIIRKDGTKRQVEVFPSLRKDSSGKPTGFRGITRDVTERKRAEKEKAELQDQLRQSQKMEAIGRLAGGVAHDFNNLLTVIKGYCQLSLAEMKESTPIRDAFEVINKATEKAADLTRQLLAFSRRQIMDVRVLDLNALLQNLDKMLRRIIGEDIELVTLLGEDLGRVKADPGQIEQVVMNLAVNAKDAMSKGGKLIIETANVDLDEAYAHAHVAATPGRYVMIAVSDTGAGMTPEVRDRVFEPFFTTKEKSRGTGLGLSTVYGIVKQSNGNIWVYSEPGKGTTFKIFLPRVDEPTEMLRVQAVKEEFSRGSETILVVEDDKEVRNLAVRILKRQGYTVLDGSYGDEAINVCRNHQGPIHLLVTDVVMPGMNGHELAKRLESFHPEMKVLYMSGYTDDAIVMHGVLVQGVNYIQKPFTVDALAKKVREVLEQ